MARDATAPELGGGYVRVGQLADLQGADCVVVQVEEHTLALFSRGEHIYAVDNRCPHMGFPLNRGTVKEGILTCHWHRARFDLASGGTFDQWADDVPVFPVQIRNGEVWVDLSSRGDAGAHHRQRLKDGLERNIPLVIGKAVIRLLDEGVDSVEPFRIGLDFGTCYRQTGWGQGLTILTCIMNLLPHLDAEDRPRALYHGLSAVARDCAGMPPRFGVHPLPALPSDFGRLKQWFRQFVEVRDAEGAERCIVSAVRAGANHRQMADMLFAAATDHRYIQIGHVADFTNKALEALDRAGWEHAEPVLASLVSSYTNADRMEESNAWRHPVDLVANRADGTAQLLIELFRRDVIELDGAVGDLHGCLQGTLGAGDPQFNVEQREGGAAGDKFDDRSLRREEIAARRQSRNETGGHRLLCRVGRHRQIINYLVDRGGRDVVGQASLGDEILRIEDALLESANFFIRQSLLFERNNGPVEIVLRGVRPIEGGVGGVSRLDYVGDRLLDTTGRRALARPVCRLLEEAM